MTSALSYVAEKHKTVTDTLCSRQHGQSTEHWASGRARNTSGSTYACTRCFSVSVGTRTNALTTAPALALTTCVKACRMC